MQVEFSTRGWLAKLDLACILCLSAVAQKQPGDAERKAQWSDWMFLLEAQLRWRGDAGPGGFSSPVADIARFLPREDVAVVDWGGWRRCGVKRWVVEGAGACQGWTHCRSGRDALLPPDSTPSHHHKGISRLFWRGPWGPFHHYTHDFLMQASPRAMYGWRWGEV